MTLAILCNAAGDFRLRVQREKKKTQQPLLPAASTLVCSSEVQELTTSGVKRERKGFGILPNSSGIGRSARTRIREVGAVLDEGRLSRTVFLTGTLPGSTGESLRAIAEQSAWIVQTCTQWIRDTAHGALYFGVWELQKRGALHIHLCVQVETDAEVRALLARWKSRWIAVLGAVGERSGVDCFARAGGTTWAAHKSITRTDAQIVEKSVARYLAKYLSKGACSKLPYATYSPTRWWFCSKLLREKSTARRLNCTVGALSPATAGDLFQRIGSAIAERTAKVFPCFSPVDFTYKGLIALLAPLEASMLFDEIRAALRTLQQGIRKYVPEAVPDIQEVAAWFSGRLISGAAAF